MPIYRFAAFNVENLFGRAKVLNFFDHSNGKNSKGNTAIEIILFLEKLKRKRGLPLVLGNK